jgi:hypothetical protein
MYLVLQPIWVLLVTKKIWTVYCGLTDMIKTEVPDLLPPWHMCQYALVSFHILEPDPFTSVGLSQSSSLTLNTTTTVHGI